MKGNGMRLVVVGASGRMGCEIIRTITAREDVELVGAIERPDSPWIGRDAGKMAGLEANGVIVDGDDPFAIFTQADGVIDFTIPQASAVFASLAAQAGIAHIIGTTGFEPQDEAIVMAASHHATIVKSGNMSLGVNMLAGLVKKAAAELGPQDFDIEIFEMHHRRKIDAPSGTALLLGEAAAKGRQINLAQHSVRGRDGITGARAQGSIGFAALRGGTVVGEHAAIFAGEGERLTLSHSAEDRSIFARGAIRAALWAKDKPHGLYSMLDVLGFND